MYLGLIINDRDQAIIDIKKLYGNCGFFEKEIVCHHVTLAWRPIGLTHLEELNDLKEKIIKENNGDNFFHVVIDRWGAIDGLSAFGVLLPFTRKLCENEMPHITWGCKAGRRPVESNNIKEWVRVTPLAIPCHLEVCD